MVKCTLFEERKARSLAIKIQVLTVVNIIRQTAHPAQETFAVNSNFFVRSTYMLISTAPRNPKRYMSIRQIPANSYTTGSTSQITTTTSSFLSINKSLM